MRPPNGSVTIGTNPTNHYVTSSLRTQHDSSTQPSPPNGKPIQGTDQSDAMAMKVERMAQQKEIEKEQFRTVLKQKDDELAQVKERYQRDLDKNKCSPRTFPEHGEQD